MELWDRPADFLSRARDRISVGRLPVPLSVSSPAARRSAVENGGAAASKRGNQLEKTFDGDGNFWKKVWERTVTCPSAGRVQALLQWP